VSEAWVVNASPLILFSRITRLDLIERLAPRILIPNAVIEEFRAGQRKDPRVVTALKWAERYRVEDIAVIASVQHWDLGRGESQVIAHCIAGSRWARYSMTAPPVAAPPLTTCRSSERLESSCARSRNSLLRMPVRS